MHSASATCAPRDNKMDDGYDVARVTGLALELENIGVMLER